MSLSTLGLTAPQQACYRVLLIDPGVSVRRLTEETGLSAVEVDVALAGLQELQLVLDSAEAPSGVVALRPVSALSELASRRAEEHTRELLAIAGTHAQIQALDELVAHREARARDEATEALVQVLRGRDAVQSFLDELSVSSRRSMDSVVPRGRSPRTRFTANARTVHRGEAVRWLLAAGALDDPDFERHLVEMVEAGAQTRISAEPLDRVIIADREVAVLPLDVGDRNAGAVVVRQAALLRAVQLSFDTLWQRAVPLRVERGRLVHPAPPDTSETRELLAALVTHPTDEAAARDLAISARHLRRRLSRTLALLGARNRFHAGALAQQLGLLDASGTGPDQTARNGRPRDESGA